MTTNGQPGDDADRTGELRPTTGDADGPPAGPAPSKRRRFVRLQFPPGATAQEIADKINAELGRARSEEAAGGTGADQAGDADGKE